MQYSLQHAGRAELPGAPHPVTVRPGEPIPHRETLVKNFRGIKASVRAGIYSTFLDKDSPALEQEDKRSAGRSAPHNKYFGRTYTMTFIDICKAYGEIHDMNTIDVIDQYNKGLITQYELFDAFLQNEGIYGYTQKIITAFRTVYEIE